MIWLAGGAVGALAVSVIACFQLTDHMLRAHARERNLMLNQLLHLAGRTWEPPPVEPAENGFNPDAEVDARFTTSPTQLPDY